MTLYPTAEELAWIKDAFRTTKSDCGDCKQRLFESFEKVT
jgi:hypothetical protein